MFIDLMKEAWYLVKFQKAISNTNLGNAAKYLKLHKEASDAVEVSVKTTMADVKAEMQAQKELIGHIEESL